MSIIGRDLSVRGIATVMMAALGAGFLVVFALQDAPAEGLVWVDLPWRIILRYVLAMGIGGGLVGWLLAGCFGRRGAAGWFYALLGGFAATLVAGLVGSAVGQLPVVLLDGWQMADLIPIAFGLLVAPLVIASRPILVLAWIAMIVATHLLARRARAAAPK